MAEIITLQAGALATNCYLIGDSASDKCAVVDPGGHPGRISEALRSTGWEVEYVLATHGHADHTGAISPILDSFGGQFAAGSGDVDMIVDPPEWLTSILGDFEPPPRPTLLLEGGEVISLGSTNIGVLATPGHTPGSLCYSVGDAVCTGDTLFKGSIGRYDLPGGDGDLELDSIRNVLMPLDDLVKVLPGHGPSSTIGEERRVNPFLRP